jgi:CDP-L-myo-inositol myo-inositolphosphotransferase
LDEPFLLLMADNLISPAILNGLIGHGLDGSDLVLAVDERTLANGCIEDGDVTRVLVEENRIRLIGKGLERFNGYDTGAFLCTPGLFNALEQAVARGDTSLSAGVNELANEGRAGAFPVSSGFWIDVDTPADLRKAERLLLDSLGKRTDGPVSRYLNRRFSRAVSARLSRTSVTPNAVSLASFLLALAGSLLFLHPSYWALAAGGVAAQLSSILDGSDGEVARLKWMTTKFGGWLDSILDRYADAFLLGGLTYHASLDRPGALTLAVGFFALAGSFVNTYSAVLFDEASREGFAPSRTGRFRIGRDTRLLLVFLGALTNLPLVALGLIALLMNAEVVRRVTVLRRALRPHG